MSGLDRFALALSWPAGQQDSTPTEGSARPPRSARASLAPIKNGVKLAIEGEKLAAMPLDPAGIGAALGALDVEGKLDVEAEQVDLFASSPLFAGDRVLQPVRGAGRPPGARNKTTEEWKAFWLRHYRSPLLFLGDLISANPFQLHAAIRAADGAAGVEREISVMDVINLQRGAAADVAPFVHRKQPIAIDAGDDKSVPLIAMFQLDPASLQHAIAQAAENAGELALVPAPLEGEVAAAKSQPQGEGGASA
ncbi:MAG: hypothetical protein BroJett013_30440 [Alphaproteobacteria bacterium]|nr:MAG: hypothetical protein BroJett013_30440 [Alphaproteobacteria bacterium]